MPLPYLSRSIAPRAAVAERITASKWNRLGEAVDLLTQVSLRGAQVPAQRANGIVFRRFLFQSFPSGKTDYMVCLVPGVGGAQVNVAKPFGLRPSLSSHAGVSFSYSTDIARTAGGSESQVIVPGWSVGDPVIAMGPIDTGLVLSGQPILWLDTNMAFNRGWAADV